MIVYLFSDIYKEYNRFFNVNQPEETNFLYDIAFGFMPRKFEPTDEDRIIYDEEEEVTEMYFIKEGSVDIAFSLIGKGMKDNYTLGKKLTGSQLICDHYVVNLQKSQFIYLATKDINCYALTKKFIHQEVFSKYPEIKA